MYVHRLKQLVYRAIFPTNCMIKALKICLESNSSIFDNNYSQCHGRAKYHLSRLKVIKDMKVLEYNPTDIVWKRFREVITRVVIC